jgi:peptidoglycan/xylan/chitin deacetylase (PgdA/CDA1 family)
MRVPILTYHAANVASSDYVGNDHVALAADLETLHAAGWRVLPLSRVVDAYESPDAALLHRCIALTCDDGTDFDFHDLEFPGYGVQRSFTNILHDFRTRHGRAAQPGLHLTSFVIADPAARRAIDRACMFARDQIGEGWWSAAQASGLVSIENHSWDHNHPCLNPDTPDGMPRGDFHTVNNDARAEFEITRAQDHLRACLGSAPSMFCYPFGHVADFLRAHWLPRRGPATGLRAAFGDGARPVTFADDRWNLPRYVCGWHWKTPEDFAALLRDLG